MTGIVQPFQILGVMRKISIHFKNKIIPVGQSPFKTSDVSGSEPKLTCSLDEKKFVGMKLLHRFYNISRSIWRIIVDDQQMVLLTKIDDGINDELDVFFFLVGWYDDELLQISVSINCLKMFWVSA